MSDPVVIVGAGLAGLCCGRRLAQCNVPFRILEASDAVGGRVRTDVVDGFRLDRGFQIYLTEYPEGKRVLDYAALDFKPFTRGALVRYRGKFHRLADPRSEPFGAMPAAFNPVGTFADKLRAAKLLWHVEAHPDHATAPDVPTLDFLRTTGGFTDAMISRLFRPFFGGVFLEPDLATSSRLFRFLFQMFGTGPGAVPAAGMQAIPEQIAAGLPAGSIAFQASVTAVSPTGVTLATGETIPARAVVVATDGPAAARLTGQVPDPGSHGNTTLYYATDKPPVDEPILMLDGDGGGPVNNIVVMSQASAMYAPAGQHLVAASVIGVPAVADATLDKQVREQLTGWYGPGVSGWRLLRVYRIPHALPDNTVGKLDPWQRPVALANGLFVCGDHRDNGSIDGAMTSGFRAAQAVMEALEPAKAHG